MYTSLVPQSLLICVDWPHAGSSVDVDGVAASLLPGDIFARYNRMAGRSVLVVASGSAQNSDFPLTQQDSWQIPLALIEQLGVDVDACANPTAESHQRCAQNIFLTLLNRGHIVKGSLDAPYCTVDKRIVADHYVEGTCPYCNFDGARATGCEKCGRRLDPAQLLNARCRLCGNPSIEIGETEQFFLDLPQFSVALRQWLQSGKVHWSTGVWNSTLNRLKEGLTPLAVTGDLELGVPVPVSGYEEKRLQGWFDALVGYYSASVSWASRHDDPNAWKQWWASGQPSDDDRGHVYYFALRDHLAIHTIAWPAILMGHSDMALPYDVFSSGLAATSNSTPRSHEADAVAVPDILDRYGADSLRFYLAKQDSPPDNATFSCRDLVRLNNDHLVGAYGNTAHRVLTLLQRSYGGTVPQPGALHSKDQAILQATEDCLAELGDHISRLRLRDGLDTILLLTRSANRYLDEQAPWKRIAVDSESATTMYVMLQILNGLKALFAPYLPFSSQRLHELLGFSGSVGESAWEAGIVPPGRKLPAPTPLFAKFDIPPS